MIKVNPSKWEYLKETTLKRKRKKKDIINLKDPKARKIVNKYRKQIEKSADRIMSL